jgi:hypothetical protein
MLNTVKLIINTDFPVFKAGDCNIEFSNNTTLKENI